MMFSLATCTPFVTNHNGLLGCSLGDDGTPHPGDSCSFACNPFLGQHGNTTRTCQSDGTWSESKCISSVHLKIALSL